jgi:hypothetical protein
MLSYVDIMQEQKLFHKLSKEIKDMYENLYFRQQFNTHQDTTSKKHHNKQIKN